MGAFPFIPVTIRQLCKIAPNLSLKVNVCILLKKLKSKVVSNPVKWFFDFDFLIRQDGGLCSTHLKNGKVGVLVTPTNALWLLHLF